MPSTFAHIKWFVDDHLQKIPGLTTSEWLFVAGLMVVTAILLGLDEVYGHLFALSLVAVAWMQPELRALVPHKAARKKGKN